MIKFLYSCPESSFNFVNRTNISINNERSVLIYSIFHLIPIWIYLWIPSDFSVPFRESNQQHISISFTEIGGYLDKRNWPISTFVVLESLEYFRSWRSRNFSGQFSLFSFFTLLPSPPSPPFLPSKLLRIRGIL